MSLPQTLSHLLIHIGTSFAHVESTLHIPTCLRFFPPSASPDELCTLALLFVVAPLHGYMTLPMLDYLGLGEREAGWRWEWRRNINPPHRHHRRSLPHLIKSPSTTSA
ncbi:hypothetical protein SNOG_02659 [Parastagonospora nodorum SN15]|uniref:Uncharacterized protein n=1 Tax=Phaeosphaeria nodorum (strain SN15 / ATCC MYA-4574 / FGSC 10173) TaxID=321614 RepID=Q0V005_PHANO|nr:hypothetical protein SNOG_02659 [Parastagonospora nodorum SN15]EAT89390.1 hypothetical protein SNOG_02659 [Parastagonospora nodorum SN15]